MSATPWNIAAREIVAARWSPITPERKRELDEGRLPRNEDERQYVEMLEILRRQLRRANPAGIPVQEG